MTRLKILLWIVALSQLVLGALTLIAPGAFFAWMGLRLKSVEAVQAANAAGTFVAADLNYRSKVEPDKSKARAINQKLAPYLGFLVGNDSDLSDALGYLVWQECRRKFSIGEQRNWLPGG